MSIQVGFSDFSAHHIICSAPLTSENPTGDVPQCFYSREVLDDLELAIASLNGASCSCGWVSRALIEDRYLGRYFSSLNKLPKLLMKLNCCLSLSYLVLPLLGPRRV
jgi:hypothetical protein